MNKIVKIEESRSSGGDGIAVVEQFDGDSSEHNIFSPPNFESLPFPDDQALMIQTDKRGAQAVSGVALETNIKPGEVRIPWYDVNKSLKGFLKVENSGTFQLENNGEEQATILIDLLQVLIDALVVTALGPSPFDSATIALLTAIKTRLETFKG